MVLRVEQMLLTCCSSVSFVSKGKFNSFCLWFADKFDTDTEDWKPNFESGSTTRCSRCKAFYFLFPLMTLSCAWVKWRELNNLSLFATAANDNLMILYFQVLFPKELTNYAPEHKGILWHQVRVLAIERQSPERIGNEYDSKLRCSFSYSAALFTMLLPPSTINP